MMSKKTHKYLEDYMQPFYNFYNQLKPIMYFRYAYFFFYYFLSRESRNTKFRRLRRRPSNGRKGGRTLLLMFQFLDGVVSL